MRIIFTSSILAILLVSCGTSSSKKEQNPSFLTITGAVSSVQKAEVFMLCGSKKYKAKALTDKDAKFTITLPKQDLNSCVLYANDGYNGLSLKGLSLSASFAVFQKTKQIDAISTMLNNSNKENVENFVSSDKLDLNKQKLNAKLLVLASLKGVDGKPALDLRQLPEKSLKDYIKTHEEKEKINEFFAQIDSATTGEQIPSKLQIAQSFLVLQKLYKQNTYTSTQKQNLQALATKIAKSNAPNTSAMSNYKIRKALLSLDLLPKFANSTDLEAGLLAKLDKSKELFLQSIDKPLALSNINGLKINDSKTTKQILGSDNQKRINYYTFSDKSHLYKISTLEENAYSDNVTDVLHAQIAKALARLGFDTEAIESVKNDIYDPDAKQDAYDDLSDIFKEIGKKDQAAQMLKNRFIVLKQEIKASGEANFNNAQSARLQSIAKSLSALGKKEDAKEVVAYLEHLAPNLKTAIVFARLAQSFEDLAENALLENKDKALAIDYVNRGDKVIKNFPIDNARLTKMYVYRFAITAVLLGQNPTNSLSKLNTPEINAIATYQKHLKPALMALQKDLANAKQEFNALSANEKRMSLGVGYATSLWLFGDSADKTALFSEYDKLSTLNLARELSDKPTTTLPTLLSIQTLGDEQKLEGFLDETFANIKKRSLTTDTQKYEIYGRQYRGATWGLLSVAKFYLGLKSSAKAKSVLDYIQANIENFSDKQVATQSLIELINFKNTFNLALTTELDKLYEYANDIVVGNTLTRANIQTINTLISASSMLKNDLALKLLDKLNIPDNRTLADLKAQNPILFNLAIAYLKAGNKQKAKEQIKKAQTSLNNLETSVDKDKLMTSLAKAYAQINDLENALNIARKITTTKEKEQAIIAIANGLSAYSAFNSSVASIDSDEDGKPDFFNLGVSTDDIARSKLVLDDDIDGDGILDTIDDLPYDAVK